MSRKSILLGAVAALAFAGTAQAGHFTGWYVGLEGGGSWVEDADFTPFGTVGGVVTHTDPANTLTLDTGWAIFGTAGYGLYDSNFRVELELGYRNNEIDHTIVSPVNGDLSQFTAMANVLYDIPLGSRLSLSLGAGVGADAADVDFGPFNDDDWVFAYQGIVGLSYALSDRTDLVLNYRFLRTGETEFEGIAAHRLDFEEMNKHAVTLGIRFDLSPDEEPVATPGSPPQPEPPPTAAQFIIFFGFGKCNITAEADRVLGEAASNAKSFGSARISIVGHTDTVGSSSRNQRLSECRASAAKRNLVGKGIPAGAIAASGKGETELMVQTGDNVREPQNRRATIDLD